YLIAMVLVAFLDANNDVWHLRAILLRRHDGDESAPSVGHVHVTWRPGDHAVHTHVLGFPGQPAIMYDFAVFTGICIIDFRSLDVVRRVDTIQRIWVVRVFVRIILDLVVCRPL